MQLLTHKAVRNQAQALQDASASSVLLTERHNYKLHSLNLFHIYSSSSQAHPSPPPDTYASLELLLLWWFAYCCRPRHKRRFVRRSHHQLYPYQSSVPVIVLNTVCEHACVHADVDRLPSMIILQAGLIFTTNIIRLAI